MEATSVVFKQLIQREMIGKFERRLYNKTKETEVNIFLAKKKNGDKIKRKEITLGPLQRKIGVGEKIKHYECSTVVRCSIIIFCIVVEV